MNPNPNFHNFSKITFIASANGSEEEKEKLESSKILLKTSNATDLLLMHDLPAAELLSRPKFHLVAKSNALATNMSDMEFSSRIVLTECI